MSAGSTPPTRFLESNPLPTTTPEAARNPRPASGTPSAIATASPKPATARPHTTLDQTTATPWRVMRETQGKADPKVVNELLKKALDG